MNGALPEMLHSLAGNCTDMSLLERERVTLKPKQNDQFNTINNDPQFFNVNDFGMFSIHSQAQQFENCETGTENGFPELGGFGPGEFGNGSGFGGSVGIYRTMSLPIQMESKKRKYDNNDNHKAVVEHDYKEKKMKTCSKEGDTKITEQNSNNEIIKINMKKENFTDDSNITEVPKPDYIHVRARRGQATDSHSLAERVRREKISERMKYLQDIVPGCNKITGKAGMLDEIINYVQSLQRQVELLSMKLAAMNPTLGFNIENIFAEEALSTCSHNFPIGVSSEITNPTFLPFSPLEQLFSFSGLEMGLNQSDTTLRRTISAPVSIPETFFDPSIVFNQIQSSTNWEANLQSLNYGMELVQGASKSFPPNQFPGHSEVSNMKMQMM